MAVATLNASDAAKQAHGPHYKHGHGVSAKRDGKASPEYHSWTAMKARCYNPGNNRYYRYGARGITVCDRWANKEHGFENFLADLGEKPDPKRKYSIDRRDNDGNYEPSNCFWNVAGGPTGQMARRVAFTQPLRRKDVTTKQVVTAYRKFRSMPIVSRLLSISIPTVQRRLQMADVKVNPLGTNQFSNTAALSQSKPPKRADKFVSKRRKTAA